MILSPSILYSVVATFFNFAKASVGSGSFALPFAVLSAGVLVGSAGMALLGIIRSATHCKLTTCIEYTNVCNKNVVIILKGGYFLEVRACNY